MIENEKNNVKEEVNTLKKDKNKETTKNTKLSNEITLLNNSMLKLNTELHSTNLSLSSLKCFINNNKSTGEFYSAKDLDKLSSKNRDFTFFNNVHVSCTDGNTKYLRQIDHLIITKKGLFVIETKYWKGNIFHNLKLNEMPKSLKFLYPLTDTERVTFRILNSTYDKENKSYDNNFYSSNFLNVILPEQYPINQAKFTSKVLFDSLNNNNLKCGFVNALVYYNYPHDEYNKVHHNGSLDITDKNCEGFTNFESMEAYFDLCMAKNDNISEELYQTLLDTFSNDNFI